MNIINKLPDPVWKVIINRSYVVVFQNDGLKRSYSLASVKSEAIPPDLPTGVLASEEAGRAGPSNRPARYSLRGR